MNALSIARRSPTVTAAVLVGVAAGILELAGFPLAAHLLIAALGITISGIEAFRMIRDLRSGRWGLDVLAISAVIATLVLQEFWAAFIVTLMIVGGEALEQYASARARRQISALVDAAPTSAHVLEGEMTRDIPVTDVAIGDRLLVRAGEAVPVDATLVDESGEFDMSSLTGESLPVTRPAESVIASGVVVLGTAVTVVAVARAAESQYQRIVAMVEAGAGIRGKYVRLADRIAIPFTAVAYLIAGLAWLLSGDPIRFAEVLVVATPCPLLVAAPTALVAGMGRSARQGIVVKSGETLERLADVRSVAFDKTGTLTLGEPAVDRCEPIGEVAPDALLGLAAAVESGSTHVLADAIVNAAHHRGIALPKVSQVKEFTGTGLTAMWEGHDVRVGKAAFAAGPLAASPAPLGAGEIAVYLAIDGIPAGRIVLRDEVRADAQQVIAELRRDGAASIIMVTGDAEDNAHRVAAELGLDEWHSGLLPADKVAIVAALRPHSVLMVGDGINDAPVLAAADVGIAMGARGATAASESAEAVLLVDELGRIPRVLETARRTLRIARQSIIIGIGLSLLLMLIATTGVIPAFVGALGQEAIDVVTILNGLRAGGGRRRALPARTDVILAHDEVHTRSA